MAFLRARFLGGMAYDLDGRPLDISLSRKGEALCCYLLCNLGKTFSRDYLAELFWADSSPEAAKYNLRYALWLLRRALGEGSTAVASSETFILSTRSYIRFNEKSPVEVDSLQFEKRAKAALAALSDKGVPQRDRVEEVESVVCMYRGDFLKGFNVKSSPDFEDWILVEKERLQAVYLRALEYLISALIALREYGKAIHYSNRMLAINPLDEAVHCKLIRLYSLTGQRGQAIKQYRICSEILRQELNVTPSPETRNAFAMAIRGEQAGTMVDHGARPDMSPRPRVVPGFPVEPGVYYMVCQEDTEEFRRLLVLYETFCKTGECWRIHLRACPQDRVAFSMAAEFVRALLRLMSDHGARFPPGALSETLSVLAPEMTCLGKTSPGFSLALGYNPLMEYKIADAVLSLALTVARERLLTALISHLEWADEYSLRIFAFLASRLRRRGEATDADPRIVLLLHSSVALGLFNGL